MTQHECVAGQYLVVAKLAKKCGKPTDLESVAELMEDGGYKKTLSNEENYAMGYLRGAAEVLDLTVLELLDQVDGLPEVP